MNRRARISLRFGAPLIARAKAVGPTAECVKFSHSPRTKCARGQAWWAIRLRGQNAQDYHSGVDHCRGGRNHRRFVGVDVAQAEHRETGGVAHRRWRAAAADQRGALW
jgi:hypothetical protein